MSKTNTDVVTLSYDDLLDFRPQNDKKNLVGDIEGAFGPKGLGILLVEGVPEFQKLRSDLLPLARKIPDLPDLDSCVDKRSSYSRGWSHGKEQLSPGIPDWQKGSFYANPHSEALADTFAEDDGRRDFWKQQASEHPSFYAPNVWPTSLPQLQPAFVAMGRKVCNVGTLVCRVCDAYCAKYGAKTSLEEHVLKSKIATGRLLHYFAAKDEQTNKNAMWCGWHNDHSALTGLVPGAYFDKASEESIPSPDPSAGLYIQSRSGEIVRAIFPSSACGFQIGETSQVLSGGLLRATPHAVQSASTPQISRESFAVFMAPSFDTPMRVPTSSFTADQAIGDETMLPKGMVPLSQRWNEGQCYGDFHIKTITSFVVD